VTPPPPPSGYLPVANWRLLDIGFVFVAGLVGSILVAAAITAAGIDPLSPLPFSLIFGGQSAASFLVMWTLSRSRGSGSLAADVGLIVRGSDWWGVPAGMALQVVIAVVTAPLIIWLFPDGAPEQGIAEIAAESQSVIDQLSVFIAVAVAAPLIEEMLFRGMLLSWLARRMRSWVAIVVSAAVFAGVHLLDPNAIAVVPGLFLLGVVLAWVAVRKGDLSLPIAIHSGINLLAAISILYGAQLLEWSETQLDQLEGIIHFFPF
jgi:membrane protease YdiL (CAAX protease family)